MRQPAQKYETSFVWRKPLEGFIWKNSVPCNHWGEPFDTMSRREREKYKDEISSAPEGPFLIEKQPGLSHLPYFPLENPMLFAQFSDISPTEESFLDWANKQGRLIDIERNKEYAFNFLLSPFTPRSRENLENARSSGLYRTSEKDGRFYLIAKPDPLNFWKTEHRDLGYAVMLWEMATNNDPRLNYIIEWKEDTRRAYVYPFHKEKLDEINFDKIEMGERNFPGFVLPPRKILGYSPKKFDAKKAALRYVLNEISRKLSLYPLMFCFEINEKEQLNKNLVPSSLLSAMWYQLLLVQTGEIKLKRCSICGRWENMDGHRESWSKHANCANYERVKRARNKKRGRA